MTDPLVIRHSERGCSPTRANMETVASEWKYDAERPDVWTWLQSWYVQQCDDEWEHAYGITIGTLDHPGWSVKIDLSDTGLEGRPWVARRSVHRSEDDWCETWVEDAAFNAACGPQNLAEALHEFRAWATDD